MIVLLALLLPQQDLDEVDRESRALERRMEELDAALRDAMKAGKPDRVEALNLERRETETRLELLRRRREALLAERRPAAPAGSFLRVEAGLLWNGFDDDLGMDDGIGLHAGVRLPVEPDLDAWLAFRLSDVNGDAPDEEIDARAELIGLSYSFGSGAVRFHVGAAVGIIRFHSDKGGADTALLIEVEPGASIRVAENLRVRAGAPIDLVRTHFRESDGLALNFGLLFSIEYGF